MKVLVALKRVPDPENTSKIRVSACGSTVDTSALAWKTNPFDELALEAGLRLTEDGRAPRVRLGEVVATTVGPPGADSILRSALALGATRALRIQADDSRLDGLGIARALAQLARQERPDLVLLGKQSADGDTGQVGQQLAELLDWPCAAGCSGIALGDGCLEVNREVEDGILELRVELPAVLTIDLRIARGDSVYSAQTPRSHTYRDGLRFAPLPAIIRAKSKPLDVLALDDLVDAPLPLLAYVEFEKPPRRAACAIASTTDELAGRLEHLARSLE